MEKQEKFDLLTKKIIEFRNERDWKQFHNPKDLSLSLLLEACELMEHFQWKNIEQAEAHIKTHRTELGEELADILYWVILISHDLKIDVLRCLDKKLIKNAAKYPVNKARGNAKKYTELEKL